MASIESTRGASGRDPEAGIRALIERTLGRPARSLAALGDGTDHHAFLVDGQLVARVRRSLDESAVLEIQREREVLRVVGGASPVAVPEVVAVDAAAGIIVVTKLEGSPLLGRPIVDGAPLVGPLADLLAALHGIGAGALGAGLIVDDATLADYRDEAAEALPRAAGVLSLEQVRLVEAFLDAPLPGEPADLLFGHNDLGAEHILVGADGSTVTGVIDWSDAAVSDPARDLGRLYRDLGPEVAGGVLARLDVDQEPTLRRAAFHARCALLEDLCFGIEADRPSYVEAARASLTRTFGAS